MATVEVDYTANVYTAQKLFAGTDANVFITLFSKKDSTGKLPLKPDNAVEKFSTGSTRTCSFKAKNIGEIINIQIHHDNAGQSPGWFLDKISVNDKEFPCYQWLAKDTKLSVILACDRDSFCNTLYEYTHDQIVHTPYLEELPLEQYPSLEWFGQMKELVSEIIGKDLADMQANDPAAIEAIMQAFENPGVQSALEFAANLPQTVINISTFLHAVEHLMKTAAKTADNEPSLVTLLQNRALHGVWKVASFLNSMIATLAPGSPERATSVDDFGNLTKDPKEDLQTWIDYNHTTNVVVSDKAFAEYRLSGPNPTTIKVATADDITILYNGLDDDDVKLCTSKIPQGKTFFVVDYSSLALFSPNKSYIGGIQKYVMGSMALFQLEQTIIVPLCIKLIGRDNWKSKMFFPDGPDGRANNDYSWEMAKFVFQSHDADYHEALVHLAGTHLVAEIFMVATYRRFPLDHPLFKLLTPHFEGTAFINQGATALLVSDKGGVDTLVSQDIEEIRVAVKETNAHVTSKDMRFPEQLKARGMTKENFPDLIYPYRDDGLLIWETIYTWVSDYVDIFYPSDDKVASDSYIRRWIQDLNSKDGGNVKWLDQFKFTNAWLKDLIASVIFNASADHAAVNFTQGSHMQFIPTFSLAIYNGEEVCFKQHSTQEDYLSLLPPKSVASKQALIMKLLSGVVYTRLGYYDKKGEVVGNHFQYIKVDHEYIQFVVDALKKFHSSLDKVTEEINTRNKSRPVYIMLLPEKIPQSVNV